MVDRFILNCWCKLASMKSLKHFCGSPEIRESPEYYILQILYFAHFIKCTCDIFPDISHSVFVQCEDYDVDAMEDYDSLTLSRCISRYPYSRHILSIVLFLSFSFPSRDTKTFSSPRTYPSYYTIHLCPR